MQNVFDLRDLVQSSGAAVGSGHNLDERPIRPPPDRLREGHVQIIGTIDGLRDRLDSHRREGRSIGFVPTMGYLHLGHMTLVRRARQDADIVVASIFVNPLQFGKNEDFSRYPRDLERDCAMLEAEGVDYVFAPEVDDMYPKPIQTIVDVKDLGNQLEGEVRPGHFAGVSTVVTKLFNIVGPCSAFFGEKDFQQLQIIRRMADDLNQPVRVVGVPTVREHDGLAYSSRNSYLTPQERAAAVIVPRALAEAERLVAAGERDVAFLEAAITAFIAGEPLANPEVVAIRDPDTLERITTIGDRPALLLLFVRFGKTRLLDNRLLAADKARGDRP